MENCRFSANAQRQRAANESQAALCYRLAEAWWDDLIALTVRDRNHHVESSLTRLVEDQRIHEQSCNHRWLTSGAGACKQAREAPGTATAMFGGWAADNKGCCSGSKLGIFDWRAMAASGAWSIPSFYNAQKNLKLISVTQNEQLTKQR